MKNKNKNKNSYFFSKFNRITISYIFLILLIGVIGNSIDMIIHDSVKERYKDYKLYDTIHLITPNFKQITLLLDFITLCLVFFIFFHKNVNSIIYLQKAFKIYFLRLLCIYSTILPSADNKCNPNVLRGCHDFIYSGHISITLLNCLYLYELYPSTKLFIILFIFFYSVLIVSSRMHYTVDAILAIYITYNIYYNNNSNKNNSKIINS